MIITWSLLYQFQTPHLQMMVQAQGLPLVVRPVAVQWLVAVVTYLWVRSALHAYRHVDRVEAVAALEHHRALEERARAEAWAELAESVERLIRHHVQVINHRSFAHYTPIPVRSYPHLLLPLVNALNLLHRRLLEARHMEREYGRLLWDIFRRVEQLEQNQLEELKQPGGTVLDALLFQLARHRSLPGQVEQRQATADQEAL